MNLKDLQEEINRAVESFEGKNVKPDDVPIYVQIQNERKKTPVWSDEIECHYNDGNTTGVVLVGFDV